LTIFEMLELLETEIVALRARTHELQLALQAREQLPVAPASGKKKKRPAKKKAKRKVAAKKAAKKDEQLSLPALAEETKPEQDSRPLGKRVALGKSLVQLRRVSAARPL
jgi:hypothetical protein